MSGILYQTKKQQQNCGVKNMLVKDWFSPDYDSSFWPLLCKVSTVSAVSVLITVFYMVKWEIMKFIWGRSCSSCLGTNACRDLVCFSCTIILLPGVRQIWSYWFFSFHMQLLLNRKLIYILKVKLMNCERGESAVLSVYYTSFDNKFKKKKTKP